MFKHSLVVLATLSVGVGSLCRSSSAAENSPPSGNNAQGTAVANAVASIESESTLARTAPAPTSQPGTLSDDSGTLQRRTKARSGEQEKVARRAIGSSLPYMNGMIPLAVVLGLIAAGAMAFKKWGGRLSAAVGGGGRHMELVSRLALSPKQSVCLVRVGKQLLVVGVTPDQVSRLHLIDHPDTVAGLLAGTKDSGTRAGHGAFGGLFDAESSNYDAMNEEVVPPELPMTPDGRHYRQAKMELSGLLDKLRSRPSADGVESPEQPARSGGSNTIAIA